MTQGAVHFNTGLGISLFVEIGVMELVELKHKPWVNWLAMS